MKSASSYRGRLVKSIIASTVILLIVLSLTAFMITNKINSNYEGYENLLARNDIKLIHFYLQNADSTNHINKALDFIRYYERSDYYERTYERSLKHFVIFSPDGTITHSLDSNLIGKDHSDIFRRTKQSDPYEITSVRPLINQGRCIDCHEKKQRVLGIVEIAFSLDHVKYHSRNNMQIIYGYMIIAGIVLMAAINVSVILVCAKGKPPNKSL